MDTSDVDKTLLRFIEIIATAHETKEIHFFNSISEMKIPEAVLKNFPEIKDKSIEERRKMIQNLVSSTLPEKLVAISEVHIKEGSRSNHDGTPQRFCWWWHTFKSISAKSRLCYFHYTRKFRIKFKLDSCALRFLCAF